MKIKKIIITVALLFSCYGIYSQSWDLTFIPDTGYRLQNASIPRIMYDTVTQKYFLYYGEYPSGINKYAISTDGMHFSGSYTQPNATVISDTSYLHNPKIYDLYDGISRVYYFAGNPPNFSDTIISKSSTDRMNFSVDTGFRYILQPNDQGTMGVNDFFTLAHDTVVFLYIGDMFNRNNTRLAVSGDKGNSFNFISNNVFGDYNSGGGSHTYVDIKATPLDDGSVRIFTMKGGNQLYCFKTHNGINYTPEGLVLQASDFTGINAQSLNDPQCIKLPDGRYRIYVASNIGGTTWCILSATTGFPTNINYNEREKDNITIYPNPFTELLNVKTNQNNLLFIEVFDLTGRKLIHKDYNTLNYGNILQLNLGNLSKGSYLIKIQKGNCQVNKVILKTSNF